jgi:hypothetical protein
VGLGRDRLPGGARGGEKKGEESEERVLHGETPIETSAAF